jgi:hypothetical protein
MEVRGVDPRDMGWETEPVGYRVYFWERRKGVGPAGPQGADPWTSEEYELTEIRDVMEAIEWANSKAGGRRYTLYAIHQRGDSGLGMIRLLGVDPTTASS